MATHRKGGSSHVAARWITLALLISLSAGCGSNGDESSSVLPDSVSTTISQTTVETTATADIQPIVLPDGYELFDGTNEGFQIAVPSHWTVFGKDDMDFKELIDQVATEVDFQGLEDQLAALFGQGGVLLGFDFGNDTAAFVDNITILRTPANPMMSALTPSGLEEFVVQEYETAGAANISTEFITLPAGEAIAVTYELPAFGNEGISLNLLGDRYDWAIAISASDLSAVTIDADIVFESLRIVP